MRQYRAKVVLYFGGKVRIRMDNGDVFNIQPHQIKSVNPFIRHGDTGTIVVQDNGTVKFIIDSEEASFKMNRLTQPHVFDTISLPLLEFKNEGSCHNQNN